MNVIIINIIGSQSVPITPHQLPHQYQCHLETCYKCKLSGLTPDLLNHGGDTQQSGRIPFRWFQYTLKCEKHQITVFPSAQKTVISIHCKPLLKQNLKTRPAGTMITICFCSELSILSWWPGRFPDSHACLSFQDRACSTAPQGYHLQNLD